MMRRNWLRFFIPSIILWVIMSTLITLNGCEVLHWPIEWAWLFVPLCFVGFIGAGASAADRP